MALSVDDVAREVRAVYAIADEDLTKAAPFCNVIRGDARCDRHFKHHGRHAHLTGFHFNRDKNWWGFARLVVWK